MGRVIVRTPNAFLMDEPLSNLDAKLRVQMRTEVSRLQKRLGTTTVYVTHDQVEAMTLGDRVAVMRGGEIQQVDRPEVLYETPINLFVAGFIGSPAMNFLPAKVSGRRPADAARRPAPARRSRRAGLGSGERDVIIGIRPEHFEDASLIGDDKRDQGVDREGQDRPARVARLGQVRLLHRPERAGHGRAPAGARRATPARATWAPARRACR